MSDPTPCCPIARNLGRLSALALVAAVLLFTARALLAAEGEKKHEKPANAVVLFDGKDLSKWQMADGSEAKWKLVDGAMEVNGGDIITKDKWKGDFVLHIEFMPPDMPQATGQAKGNSGVYLQNAYEIQVLDSYGLKEIGVGDCAAIYSKKVPDRNAAKPPAQWQTYHIELQTPKFDASGKKTKNARVTIYWNGEKVHDNVEIDSACPGGAAESPEGGGIRLQDHGNPVRFRNIWIAPLAAK